LRFHSQIPGAPIAAVLLLALFPFEARLQESSSPAEVVPAPVSPQESGKPTTEQPAPAEPEKKPAAEPRPSSIPEVVITPPPMKRVIVPREPKPAAPLPSRGRLSRREKRRNDPWQEDRPLGPQLLPHHLLLHLPLLM